jgi:hypothetical protein
MLNLFFKRLPLLIFVIGFVFSCFAQEKSSNNSIISSYDEEGNKTTTFLKGIKLGGNKVGFSIGAAFEYTGKNLEKTPCCSVIFFTAMSKKDFIFKENHNLTVWADKETFSFNNVTWRESAEGTAFIIAQIAFPEEVLVGMETEKFLKIANAKKVKMKLGNFEFTLSNEHLNGFKQLIEKMKLIKT